MAVSFHIGVLPQGPIGDYGKLAEAAEDFGFDGLWVADSQSVFRDAYATLTLCASRTKRLKLATGVTNIVTRHPAVVASNMATLDEYSGGRAILGLGVGESSVRTLGLRPARLKEIEETVPLLRALMKGETVSCQSKDIRITWAGRDVPIFIASSGPKSLRMAGRVADGVLFQVGAEPALIRYALKHIEAGATEAGRKLKDIRLFARLACSVLPDRKQAREEVTGYAAAAAGTIFTSVPQEEFPEDLWADLKKMKEQYDYFQHASSSAGHTDWMTGRILDSIAIAGTPEEAVPKFQEIINLGVEGFVLPVTAKEAEAPMRAMAEQVIPHLA